tara:strand:+ start:119 stop:1135 length:1017 start_codon:yes stop_codon:yes gene_type:complete
MKLQKGLRVLLIGAKCRFNLEYYTFNALTSLGYKVTFHGYYDKINHFEDPIRIFGTRSRLIRQMLTPIVLGKINKELVTKATKEQPDLILVIKGEIISPETIKKLRDIGCPVVLWYPDDPRYTESYVKYILPFYDNLFVVSKKSVKKYKEMGAKKVHYLPVGCDPSIHKRININSENKNSQKRDICFIGTFSRHRANIIKSLDKFQVSIWGAFWWFGRGINDRNPPTYGPNMVKIYNSTKIVLNIHDQTDFGIKTNMRLFEAAGSGAFILSDGENGLADVFEPNKEIVCFKNKKNLIELAEYYLEESAEREKIANSSYKRAHSEHTYVKRLQKLIQTI